MPLIVAHNISKDYHTEDVTVHALRGLDFEIEPASFVSFVGPSGSGKTTLLNLIGYGNRCLTAFQKRKRRLPGEASGLHFSGFQHDSRPDRL
jgi:ABC-type lipoprotein export system ATPase subunit